MTIRVVVVDDQAMVRAGFAAVLSAQSDIDVVGDAAPRSQGRGRGRTGRRGRPSRRSAAARSAGATAELAGLAGRLIMRLIDWRGKAHGAVRDGAGHADLLRGCG
jgi:hypothetical protein